MQKKKEVGLMRYKTKKAFDAQNKVVMYFQYKRRMRGVDMLEFDSNSNVEFVL